MTFYFMHYFNIKYNLYTISNYPKEDGERAKTNLVIRLTILSRLNNLVIIKNPKLVQLQGLHYFIYFLDQFLPNPT